jgi:hypothetical protein
MVRIYNAPIFFLIWYWHVRYILWLQGLSPSEVVAGYELATAKALEILATLVTHTVPDMRDYTVGALLPFLVLFFFLSCSFSCLVLFLVLFFFLSRSFSRLVRFTFIFAVLHTRNTLICMILPGANKYPLSSLFDNSSIRSLCAPLCAPLLLTLYGL